MVIGLVGLTVLFFAIYQIGYMGHLSLVNQQQARAEADRNALGNAVSLSATYVPNWEDGPDGLSHTADDIESTRGPDGGRVTMNGFTDVYRNELEAPVPLRDLVNGTSGIRDHVTSAMAGSIAASADLHEGLQALAIPVEPALSYLLPGDVRWVYLEDRVVMAGLYVQPADEAEPANEE